MKDDIPEVSEWRDPYLRYTSEIKPRLGFSPLDEAARTPFKSLHRNYEGESHSNHVKSIKNLRRDPQEILCPGAAVGMDRLGVVRHAWAGNNRLIGFAGFCAENLEEGRVAVWTRGKIILTIEGLTAGCEGMAVYAETPDRFNFAGIGPEIGRVRFIEDLHKRRASVAFRSWDDPEPLDLKVTSHGRRE